MDMLKTYLEKVIHTNRTVDVRGMLQAEELDELALDEVFVPMNVTLPNELPELRGSDYDEELRRRLIEPRDEPELEPAGEFLLRDNYIHLQESGLPLQTLWEKGNQWVLRGGPGTGKSTLLKYQTLTLARRLFRESRGNLPVLIHLKDFASAWQNMSEWTEEDALLHYIGENVLPQLGFGDSSQSGRMLEQLRYALDNRGCSLFFDDLEQVRSIEMRRHCIEAIEYLLKTYPGNQCLITTHPSAYQKEWFEHSFLTADLEFFNVEQARCFFHQWFFALEKLEDLMVDEKTRRRARDKAEQVIKPISHNPQIYSGKTSPLLCTLMVLVKRRSGNLPEKRIELYKLCLDSLLLNWEANRSHVAADTPHLERDEILPLLETLALYIRRLDIPRPVSTAEILQFSTAQMEEQNFPRKIAQQRAARFVDLLYEEDMLLTRYGENEFAFSHRIFEDYLAARAITRDTNKIDDYLKKYLFKPEWLSVIRLAAAHQGMKDEALGSAFIKAIQNHPHEREEQMHYAFRVAFQCLRETRVSFQIADHMFQSWVRLYCGKPALQSALNRLLHGTGTLRYQPKAITPLLDAVKQKDLTVRSKAVEALGNLKDPNGLPMLIDLLKEDPQPLVRAKAAEVMGIFKSPESIPALLSSLRNDNAFFVRRRAAQALARFKHPTVLPALLQSLFDDDPTIRWRTVEALGQLREPDAVQPLLRLLNEDRVAGVRWRTVEALGLLKNPAVLDELLGLLERDKDVNVRGRVVEALGNFSPLRAMPALLESLKNDRFPAVRWRAAEALGRLKDRVTTPALLHALKNDTDNAVRWSAAEALGHSGDPQAIPHLLTTLKEDIDPSVRWSAAEALGHLRAQQAVPLLLNLLGQERYASVRAKACQALGYLHDQSAAPALLNILTEDKDSHVRARSAEALGYLKDPVALPVLLNAVQHDSAPNVRWNAAEALGKLNDPAAVAGLLNVFENDDEVCVRWRAEKSLEQIDLGIVL